MKKALTVHDVSIIRVYSESIFRLKPDRLPYTRARNEEAIYSHTAKSGFVRNQPVDVGGALRIA